MLCDYHLHLKFIYCTPKRINLWPCGFPRSPPPFFLQIKHCSRFICPLKEQNLVQRVQDFWAFCNQSEIAYES